MPDKYLTRNSPGIELLKENDHDEIYRHAKGESAAWKLDVGAECNVLLEAKENFGNRWPGELCMAVESLVARVADFEELETE